MYSQQHILGAYNGLLH